LLSEEEEEDDDDDDEFATINDPLLFSSGPRVAVTGRS